MLGHAGLVWIVVVTVQRFISSAQRSFLVRREACLKVMLLPRATPILVESIPEYYYTVANACDYFNGIFGGDVVEPFVFIFFLVFRARRPS